MFALGDPSGWHEIPRAALGMTAKDRAWVPSVALAGVRPSRARGQNFLVQPAIAERIVAAANLQPGDEVIEIGPGLGILSERIAAHPIRRLHLVELDSRLAAELAQRFESAPNVQVIQSDFLKLDPVFFARSRALKVVGNLPFNAASAILRRLCEYRGAISAMVLMFQREVADRIRARAGEPGYSALSAISSLYWEIDRHFRVAAGSFFPKPKVDAEVLAMRPIANAPFASGEEQLVLDTIHAAFSARRKMVRNALSNALALEPARVEEALARAAIRPDARAETLAVADFVRLARALRPLPQTRDA